MNITATTNRILGERVEGGRVKTTDLVKPASSDSKENFSYEKVA